MKYHVGDVVKTAPEYGGRVFVIARIEGDKYQAVELKNKKRYWMGEGQIFCKERQIPPDSPILLLDAAYDADAGRRHARDMAESDADGREHWLTLARLEPGEPMEVAHDGFLREAEFVQINIAKPKKVFRARIDGKAYDFPLRAIVLP